MDGVSGSNSNASFQCVDGAVNAAESDAACVGAATAWALASPSGVGAIAGAVVTGLTCFSAGWNTAKAVDQCTSGGPEPGMSPAYGRDGFEDHRNDPADAAWRSQVQIQPLGSNSEPDDKHEGFVHRDSSF